MQSNPLPLNNNIRFYRRLNDLSPTELGDRVGKSSRTIRNIEQGISHPSVELAFRLSEILRIPIQELFFRPENEPEKRIVLME